MRQVVRGVLDPVAGQRSFTLRHVAPAPDLGRVVGYHWVVEWDLRGRGPHRQSVLPHPCVHLAFEGSGRAAAYGIVSHRFDREISGAGFVVGTRVQPGGLEALGAHVRAWQLTDRVAPLGELFGPGGDALAADVLARSAVAERVEAVEAFLRGRAAPLSSDAELVRRVLDDMLHRRSGAGTVAAFAAAHGVSPRTLQRLFREHVGIGPKWVLQRHRVHEAAERMLVDPALDLARLALDLGYADQAHFSTDFRARTGRTPAAYAAGLHG
jgi:AraC-like DNA-binding protein